MNNFKNIKNLWTWNTEGTYNIKTWQDGTVEYHNDNGDLHRIDGPAYIESNGTEQYFQRGIPHRTDGPARIWLKGDVEYKLFDKYNRTDGPAVTLVDDGLNEWYVDGVFQKSEYLE